MKSVSEILQSSSDLKRDLSHNHAFCAQVQLAGERIMATLTQGGTLYSCGNGGSACDAAHLTEELVARYKSNRRPYRAMHFADPGTVTCWGNDIGYDDVFRRQAEAFVTKNDILLGISTSGNSKNVLAAVQEAKKRGGFTIGLLGKDGGKIAPEVDLALIVPSSATERIQEVHITLIHIWCEMLEG